MCVCAGLTPAFQYRLCLAWLTAPGPSLLPASVLRHAVATHLRLPVCGIGARCGYQGQHHHGPCNAPLDLHGHHVHACGQGPRQAKHDRLRDAWQSLLRSTGWHVSAEQIVTTTAGPHRADLATISPAGTSYALDVDVTAPLAPLDSCGGQLHRASMAKAARYHTHPDGPLPGDLTFVPITLCATVPFLHVSALRLVHQLVHDLAERTLSPLAASWGFRFARTTREITAALAHANAVGAFRQFSACAGPAVG